MDVALPSTLPPSEGRPPSSRAWAGAGLAYAVAYKAAYLVAIVANLVVLGVTSSARASSFEGATISALALLANVAAAVALARRSRTGNRRRAVPLGLADGGHRRGCRSVRGWLAVLLAAVLRRLATDLHPRRRSASSLRNRRRPARLGGRLLREPGCVLASARRREHAWTAPSTPCRMAVPLHLRRPAGPPGSLGPGHPALPGVPRVRHVSQAEGDGRGETGEVAANSPIDT